MRCGGLIGFILCFFAAYTLAAQGKNVLQQRQIWYTCVLTAQLSKKYNMTLQLDERHFVKPFAQHQALGHLLLQKQLGKGWTAGPCIALFFQKYTNPQSNTNPPTIPELRPYFQVANLQNLGRVSLRHRYRAEARFFQNVSDNDKLGSGLYFNNFRFRYQLALDIVLLKATECRKNNLSLRFNDEIMLNAAAQSSMNVFDQNRFYASIYWGFNPNSGLELGYMNVYQQRKAPADFYGKHLLRLTFIQRMSFLK